MEIGLFIVMAKKKNEENNFEQSLHKLEEIVAHLESGDVALDETLSKFEEGMKLLEFCHSKLDHAEKKLKILLRDKNGQLKIQDADEEN